MSDLLYIINETKQEYIHLFHQETDDITWPFKTDWNLNDKVYVLLDLYQEFDFEDYIGLVLEDGLVKKYEGFSSTDPSVSLEFF